MEPSQDATRLAVPRGTKDLLPDQWPWWRHVRDTTERVFESFGYDRIDTPLFEHAGVYLRTAGSGTDVVEKEVYLFEDRGGDRLALRPEGTAGIARSYLEHGMASQPQPVRLYYLSPNFRYDRPQAGRYRQHTQAGAEAIGDGHPLVDAEVIDLLRTLYDELGLIDVTLRLNTIGDAVCRPRFIEDLKKYYASRLTDVCADDRVRFEKNPMRLLDCKEDRCKPVIAGAPRLREYLCEPCSAHFAQLLVYLEALGITPTIDDRLVRGLDYYTRTVFEFQPAVEGGQSALGGGGRYDGLMELLGGPATPGIGFGTGVERIILNLQRQESQPPASRPLDLFVAHVGDGAEQMALQVAAEARRSGKQAIIAAGGRSLKAQMRHADARGARFAAIIGRAEIEAGEVTFRDLTDRTEKRVRVADIPAVLEGR